MVTMKLDVVIVLVRGYGRESIFTFAADNGLNIALHFVINMVMAHMLISLKHLNYSQNLL